MHRNGEVIFYDQEERDEFALPVAETAVSAVKTATGFCEAAITINDRNLRELNSTSPQVVAEASKRQTRANRLHQVAVKIFDLCPIEHLMLVASDAERQLK